MKKILFAILMCLSLIASAETPSETLQQEGKHLIKQFAMELKGELKTAIKKGGLANGIEVCSVKASSIAESQSKNGWTISRTSLRTRNPDNAPDTWEREVLKSFEQQHQNGKTAAELTAVTYQQREDEKVFRMMKAIPAQNLCLSCHGKVLTADVKEALQEKYPQDQAVGYEAGDIRGAFSLVYRNP